jgi:RNA polymerase sigma-70 factor (ECF subfamily)
VGESPADAELLAGVRIGDLDALRRLYDRHAPWLAVRLSGRCRDPELVANALQDTFVAVWRKPSGYRGDGDVAAWLWGIAVRRLASQLRRRRDVVVAEEPVDDRAAPGADEQVLRSLEYGDVGQALARLSAPMRAVVQAVLLDGLTTREAAQLLRIPEGTVKTRLSRAKTALRSALAEGAR